MHVFVTGASGWVGSEVVRQLRAAGHEVLGLARSDKSAEAVAASGAKVLRGELTDLDVLAAGAKGADGVIHCGFIHDFSNFGHSIATDRRAIETIGAALAGSGKPFLFTSGGAGGFAPGQLITEDTRRFSEGGGPSRGETETLALGLARQNVRVMAMRLSPSVHGDGDYGFVPGLIAIARQKGVAAYIEGGDNRWAAVHRDDAARMYLLALEKGAAGACYHGAAEAGIAFRDIAAAIGQGLNLPVVSLPRDQAADHFGWMAMFAPMEIAVSSQLTRERLGWQPTGPGLIEDLERGTYFG